MYYSRINDYSLVQDLIPQITNYLVFHHNHAAYRIGYEQGKEYI